MAQITIQIPDDKIAEVIDAFADIYGWTSATGLTKAQFAKQKVAEFIKSTYREHKGMIAGNTARNTAYSEVDQVIIE